MLQIHLNYCSGESTNIKVYFTKKSLNDLGKVPFTISLYNTQWASQHETLTYWQLFDGKYFNIRKFKVISKSFKTIFYSCQRFWPPSTIKPSTLVKCKRDTQRENQTGGFKSRQSIGLKKTLYSSVYGVQFQSNGWVIFCKGPSTSEKRRFCSTVDLLIFYRSL